MPTLCSRRQITHPLVPNQALLVRFKHPARHLMHTLRQRLAQGSNPSGIFPKPPRRLESSSRTFVIFGAEMALGAILDGDVKQAGSEGEAGHRGAKAPIKLDDCRAVMGVRVKVHVSLFEVSEPCLGLRGETILQDWTKYCNCICNSGSFVSLDACVLVCCVSQLYGPNRRL